METFTEWHLCLCKEKSPISAEAAAVVGTAAQRKYSSIGLSVNTRPLYCPALKD